MLQCDFHVHIVEFFSFSYLNPIFFVLIEDFFSVNPLSFSSIDAVIEIKYKKRVPNFRLRDTVQVSNIQISTQQKEMTIIR